MREKSKILEGVSIDTITDLLEKKGFKTIVLHSEKEVKDFINDNVPDEMQVGLGDSITSCKLNIRNILFAKGSKIFYSWDGSEDYNRSMDTWEAPARPDYYITRITAMTNKGELLMKDYEKQAAIELNYPDKVYAFIGLNRIVDDFDKHNGIVKYPIISKNPTGSQFTIALLPFLDY